MCFRLVPSLGIQFDRLASLQPSGWCLHAEAILQGFLQVPRFPEGPLTWRPSLTQPVRQLDTEQVFGGRFPGPERLLGNLKVPPRLPHS